LTLGKRIGNLAPELCLYGIMELSTLESIRKLNGKPETTIEVVKGAPVYRILPNNPVFNDLIDEAGEKVYRYLERFNLVQNQNVLFLSAIRHYLYDFDELRQVNLIVNLKTINRVNHIKIFLLTINRILPQKGYFIGRFIDYHDQKKRAMEYNPPLLKRFLLLIHSVVNRIIPRIPFFNWILHIINNGKSKYITSNEAKNLLECNGFKVVDMAQIDGHIYFISQKTNDINKKVMSFATLLSNYKTKSHIINI
jgi:hypothetical protein